VVEGHHQLAEWHIGAPVIVL